MYVILYSWERERKREKIAEEMTGDKGPGMDGEFNEMWHLI